MNKIPLEFEGIIPMPKELAGYDCRICMVLQRHEADENYYILRTQKDQRVDADGHMVDYHDILEGEGTICLPDHHYAHADHSWPERVAYAEMLEARLPADEYQRLDVSRWRNRIEIV
jgi:hypothetical protein